MNNILEQYWYLPTVAVLRFDAKRLSQDNSSRRALPLPGPPDARVASTV